MPGLPGPYFLGSDDGLRGYLINDSTASASHAATSSCARSRSRCGSCAWRRDLLRRRRGADTWGTFSAARHLHQDIGVGFRALIPQSNRDLFRFDLAIPLDDGERTRRGALRFIASFDQFF